jgi:hypothetical protein
LFPLTLNVSKGRILIRLMLLTLAIVVNFGFPTLYCFASEISISDYEGESIESKTVTEVVNSMILEDEVGLHNGDILQVDELSEETSLTNETLINIYNVLTYILGIMIFFVVVLLCKFSYKFFNIFF